jgi:hypothetical protein
MCLTVDMPNKQKILDFLEVIDGADKKGGIHFLSHLKHCLLERFCRNCRIDEFQRQDSGVYLWNYIHKC